MREFDSVDRAILVALRNDARISNKPPADQAGIAPSTCKTEKGKPDSNPLFLTETVPTINRPHRLLPHPDGQLVIMTGGPDYGLTGGGMLIWDRVAKMPTVLTHKDLIPDQSTVSLVALPKGKLLGGSSTSPGTGGEKKAKEAEVYVMDLATKKVEWHAVAIPGVQEYTDMVASPKGLVYGFADRKLFFVFDPAKRQVVNQQPTETAFGLTCYQQGPRVFVRGPKGSVCRGVVPAGCIDWGPQLVPCE